MKVFQNFRGRRRVFFGFFEGCLLEKPRKTFINLLFLLFIFLTFSIVFQFFSIKNHIKLVFWSKVRPRPAKGGHNVRRPWAGRRTFGAPRLFRVLKCPPAPTPRSLLGGHQGGFAPNYYTTRIYDTTRIRSECEKRKRKRERRRRN